MMRQHVPWTVKIGLVAGALLPLAFSTPASANTPSVHAGYDAVQTGSSASAQTSFSVPTVTCPNTDFQLTGPAAIIRTSANGTNYANGGAITTGCYNGGAFYRAQLQDNGSVTIPSASPVLPGDRVQISTSVSASATTVSITDMTQGWTRSETGAGGTPTLAAVAMGAYGCTTGAHPCRPIPQFSKTTFAFSEIDGVSLAAAGAVAVDATSSTGAIEATTGKLIQHGMGFQVTWVSSCTPDPTTGKC
jgi:hypothetical protein